MRVAMQGQVGPYEVVVSGVVEWFPSGLGLIGHTLRVESAKQGNAEVGVEDVTDFLLEHIAEQEERHGVSAFEVAIVEEAKRRMATCCSRPCVCGGRICRIHGQQCQAGVSHD